MKMDIPRRKIEKSTEDQLPDDLPRCYPTVLQKYTSCRWRLCYMVLWAVTMTQSMQICMGFALVCMVGESGEDDNNATNINDNVTVNVTKMASGEFTISSSTQGLLISSAYYVAILSPLAGGALSRKFGPKRVMFLAEGLGGVATVLIPIAARTNVYLIIACRGVVGLTNLALPSSYEFWRHWAPIEEKAQLAAYAYAGYSVAGLVTFTLSGFLCQIQTDNGWPFIFYAFGGCTLLWCVIWHFTVYETPDQHPNITKQEKRFLSKRLCHHVPGINEKRSVPWRQICQSQGFWGFSVLFFLHSWNTSITANFVPLYMATVLQIPVNLNGILSSLGFFGRIVCIWFWTHANRKSLKVMSVTHTRKLVQSVGYTVCASMALLLLLLKRAHVALSVTAVTLSTTFQATTSCAGILTAIDMSPEFASSIMSVGVSMDVLGYCLGPLTASVLIPNRTVEEWARVFYLNISVYIAAMLFFLAFGTGKTQNWKSNKPKRTGSVTETGMSNAGFVNDNVVVITHL